MALAGTNFALHYHFLAGRRDTYWRDREFHVYLAIMAAAVAAIAVTTLPLYANWLKGLRDIVFTVVSLQTSTGFAVANYEKWSQSAQWVLLLVMIIGGSAGSTAGGLKVVRIYLVGKYVATDFTRLLHPQAIVPVRIGGVPVPRDIMSNILSYFALYGLAIFAGTLVVTVIRHGLGKWAKCGRDDAEQRRTGYE